MEQPGLHSLIGVHSQRGVILPRDVQPFRDAHDVAGAVGLALISGSLVLCRVPCIGDLGAVGIERNAGVVAFRRSQHAPAPVFVHDGYPIARHVEWRVVLGGSRRGSARRASAWALAVFALPAASKHIAIAAVDCHKIGSSIFSYSFYQHVHLPVHFPVHLPAPVAVFPRLPASLAQIPYTASMN